ncbi:unnamed protein product [Pylaiella littoralis]
MVVGLKLEQFDPAEPDVEELFRSLVGHLMWLANQTRPDILNAVRSVARYSHAPKQLHWQAALHVRMCACSIDQGRSETCCLARHEPKLAYHNNSLPSRDTCSI